MEIYKEIEKSFPKIEKLLTEERLLEFLQTPSVHLGKYNFGLGTIIRLKLLRPKGTLFQAFVQNGFTDRDEMTIEILKGFHQSIQRSR